MAVALAQDVQVRLEEVQVLDGHTDRVWSVAWSPDGRSLASCGGDRTVRIWANQGSDEHQKWICKCILDESHQRTIRSCEWSPCGKYLATAGFDAKTAVWEFVDGEFEMITALEGHENEVKSVAWNRSGQYLATCSRDKSVWIWETQPGDDFSFVCVLYGHTQDVKMVKWHPVRDLLVSASYDDTIKVWGEKEGDCDEDWECIQTLSGPGSGHSSTVWAISFNASGNRMASCSDDLSVMIWDTSTDPGRSNSAENGGPWKHLCTITGYHSRTIFSIDWSSMNGMIATGAGDDAVRIFSENEEFFVPGQAAGFSMVVNKDKAHSTDVNCVRWNPKNPFLLASASDDGSVKLWKLTGTSISAPANGCAS